MSEVRNISIELIEILHHSIDLPKTESSEKKRFTDYEIQKLKGCGSDPLVQVILILIGTGLRISELMSLTRFYDDLKARLLTGGLKTDAVGNRVIPIHPSIEKYLKYWLAKNGESLICK
jgi:integrase